VRQAACLPPLSSPPLLLVVALAFRSALVAFPVERRPVRPVEGRSVLHPVEGRPVLRPVEGRPALPTFPVEGRLQPALVLGRVRLLPLPLPQVAELLGRQRLVVLALKLP
jgi:hypothetical protein